MRPTLNALSKAVSTLERPAQARHLILAALDWARHKEPPFSLASASLIANLLLHKIDLTHQTWRVNHPEFRSEEVVDFAMTHASSSTDFAIGAYTWNEEHIQTITKALKKAKFPGRIILGGPQISYVKNGLEQFYPFVDIFIRGYAEKAISDFLIGKERSRGIHIAGEADLGLAASCDLETLASPFLNNIIPPQHFIRWETQRGCPFNCSFCQYKEPNKEALKRRFFADSRVKREIEWICKNPIRDIHVVDATFNSGPHYLETLKALAVHGYKGKIALQSRAEMMSTAFLDAVEELNLSGMVVLEFGLQTTNSAEQKLIERPNNLKRITQLIQEAIKRGIETEISLIFGLPLQTMSSLHSSIQFCQDLGVPIIHAFPLMLHRGTALWDKREELQLITDQHPAYASRERQTEGVTHVVASPSFSYKEWLKMNEIAAALDQKNKLYSEARDRPYQPKRATSLTSFSFFRTSEGKVYSSEPLNIPSSQTTRSQLV